jgi:putative transposase
VKQGRRDIPWLAALPAQAAQAVERSYVKSWRACWGGAGRVGAPKFKARDKTLLSVDLPQAAHFRLRKVSDKYGELHIMKVGKVRFRQHRRFPKTANITGARVFFKGGQWWISFRLTLVQTKVELTRRQASARVGGDRGIKVPLYMSDGQKIRARAMVVRVGATPAAVAGTPLCPAPAPAVESGGQEGLKGCQRAGHVRGDSRR